MTTPGPKNGNLESFITKEEFAQLTALQVDKIPELIEKIGGGAAEEILIFQFEDGSVQAGKTRRISTYNKLTEEENNIEKHLKYALSEIKILHQLSHERIIKLFGFYLDQDQIIIFMEATKRSVKNEINEKGYLSDIQAMHYFTQAAEGLEYLHSRKPSAIIHRNIKCENLLLTAENNVKLSDFGLVIDLAISSGSVSIRPTAPTSLTETLLFIAPEVNGKMDQPEAYGTKSDVWSLACALVQMLSGKPPYGQLEFIEFIQRSSPTSHDPLIYTGDLLPAANSAIKDLLNIMFTIDHNKRPGAETVLTLTREVATAVANAIVDAEVQYNVGFMYHNGQGVPQSYEEAFKWYSKIAENGCASAQYNVGNVYSNRQCAPQSFEEALKWCKKAAEEGHAEAHYNTGFTFDDEKDALHYDEEALRWYKKAAEQGQAEAQYTIGSMYQNGKGVPQSNEEALKWYSKAAELGHAAAQFYIGWMHQNGKGVPQSFEEAFNWYRKAAEQGHADAQYSTGNLYKNGNGVLQSYEEALKWYRKAADQGDAAAQNNIGSMHKNGNGVPRSFEEALKWYRKAAEQGLAAAQGNIGNMYFYGQGVSRSHKEGLIWYRKAAEQGYAAAQSRIGYMYYYGKGVTQSYEEALKWYRKAAEQGDAEAKKKIEKINRKGGGSFKRFLRKS